MRGDGRVFLRGERFWISYYRPEAGRMVEEREPAYVADGDTSRPARTEAEARRALKRRRDEIGAHRIGARTFGGPAQERILFGELLDALERQYETERRASLPQLRSHLKRVRTHFGDWTALSIDADSVRDYIEARRADPKRPADASIQRELEAIRRAFSLAADDKRLSMTPVIPTLPIGDTNARQGFVARADFQAIVDAIPDADVRDFAEWAYWTGMRKGESASLRWTTLDRDGWTLTLEPQHAKTRKARTIALEGPLREIIERRLAARRFDCSLIFHRGGAPIREFRKTWASACCKAGVGGLLFHDLRRSAIRNLIRAGVDQAVAMQISGHRTDATFRRYNITDEADVRAAVARTAAYVSTLPAQRKVEPIKRAR
jgi:integrase